MSLPAYLVREVRAPRRPAALHQRKRRTAAPCLRLAKEPCRGHSRANAIRTRESLLTLVRGLLKTIICVEDDFFRRRPLAPAAAVLRAARLGVMLTLRDLSKRHGRRLAARIEALILDEVNAMTEARGAPSAADPNRPPHATGKSKKRTTALFQQLQAGGHGRPLPLYRACAAQARPLGPPSCILGRHHLRRSASPSSQIQGRAHPNPRTPRNGGPRRPRPRPN